MKSLGGAHGTRPSSASDHLRDRCRGVRLTVYPSGGRLLPILERHLRRPGVAALIGNMVAASVEM